MTKRKNANIATDASKAPSTPKPGSKTKVVANKSPTPSDEAAAASLARLALRPSVLSAAVVETYTKTLLGEQDLGSLIDSLSSGMTDLKTGDMARAEAMLYGQAHALQAIFTNLARQAASQEYLKQWEAYLRMAMKAQNQCRMTLETLAAIKNPPVVIARQANINNGGQQQVNNGRDTPRDSRAEKYSTAKTELLEKDHGKRLDT